MKRSDWVIDFERLNALTTTIWDDPRDKSNPFSDGKWAYSVSKTTIRDYIDHFKKISDKELLNDRDIHVINTLEYNRILVHKSTLIDRKIIQILEN